MSGIYSVVDPDGDGVGLGMGPLADSRPGGRGVNNNSSNSANGMGHHSPLRPQSQLLSGLVSRAEMLVTINARIKNTVTCIVGFYKTA